jgi:broad specificity phosphatase PhoE
MAISNQIRVFLIRHPESANNAIEKTKNHACYKTLRQADPELIEKGYTQAQHLAEYLSSIS